MIDEISFSPEEDGQPVEPRKQWHLLIVDDDIDVHAMTTLTLNNVKIHGYFLKISHAYSGKEAIEYLQSRDDVDLILLDMVMETQDAGLRVARWLREDAGRREAPVIILRSGQPGTFSQAHIQNDKHFNAILEKSKVTYQVLIDTLNAMLPDNT
jgi:CheY-like chemotaxis protein